MPVPPAAMAFDAGLLITICEPVTTMPAFVVLIVLLLANVKPPLPIRRMPELAVAFVSLKLALTVIAPP